MKYSIIIPVFNRPDEVDELLGSLEAQTFRDFEVIVVEDGSTICCKEQVHAHATRLTIKYFRKDNSGPGQTRNYGAERSQGEYLIVLDSDCVLPESYLQMVDNELKANPCDAFGGPDRAHDSFTPVQKAINYSMTGFFTTGGIRGGKRKLDRFYPRSFNMGIRATLYHKLGGFSPMRFGEDIDFSIRIIKSGAKTRLFPMAWVWHKRRTDMRKFFRQVFNSGMARINLFRRHPDSLKTVHLLPAIFTVGVILMLFLSLTGAVLTLLCGQVWSPLLWLPWMPLLLFSLLVFADSSIRNHSLQVGLLSIISSYVQLTSYGLGFIKAWWMCVVRGHNEDIQGFRKTFYK